MPEPFVCGLVLAAGASRRLGQPKQLLPYGSGTLLGAVLDVARACPFDQLVCVVPGELPGVDFAGAEVVVNPASGNGCSSSIAAGLTSVHRRADVLVLMLGDMPGVTPGAVRALVAGRGGEPITACAYTDGRGHPLAFSRALFGELGAMHGDKAVWKLMDRFPVREVAVPGPIPRDVDTWADYEHVLAAGPRDLTSGLTDRRGTPAARR